jgi:hypothetical protein
MAILLIAQADDPGGRSLDALTLWLILYHHAQLAWQYSEAFDAPELREKYYETLNLANIVAEVNAVSLKLSCAYLL